MEGKTRRFDQTSVIFRRVKRSQMNQGVRLIFFSDSHLAPKFFKVVANSKKVGRHI